MFTNVVCSPTGAGFESMSMFYGKGMFPNGFSAKVLENQLAHDCLTPMGITSENVAQRYGITREEQDKFGAESFQKAAKAQKEGLWKDEITPVKVKWINPKTKQEEEIVVDRDDGIRDGTTAATLAKLKPAFAADGTTTAGTSSQVSDGAAAILLARRSVAQKLKLPIVGKFVGAKVVGGTCILLRHMAIPALNTNIFTVRAYSPTRYHGCWSGFRHPCRLEEDWPRYQRH